MQIKNINDVTDLINEDRILNLNIIGRLKFDPQCEITMDDEEKGFVIKCDYWHGIFSTDDLVAEELIKKINNDTEKGFPGVGEKYYHMVKKHYPIKWDEFCHLYYLEEKDLNTSLLAHTVDSLTERDVELVYEHYTYKSEDNIGYIRDCIMSRPTSVVRDPQGNAVSWAVIREDGSMGIMYTLKEHRGKGYALSVSVDLAKKAFNLGLTPYVHIVKGNTPSVKLAESLGFKYYGDVVWFGI